MINKTETLTVRRRSVLLDAADVGRCDVDVDYETPIVVTWTEREER